jgi:hypothetical protein
VSELETPWSSLAARVVRVVLARKDFGYAQLSEALASVGVKESNRALASRVSRGRIKLSLLLQILTVTGSKVPALWGTAISTPGTWEQRAKGVVVAELCRQPLVTFDELAQRMIRLGADLTEKTLMSHLDEGIISLPEFLQCLVALGSSSLERYVDYEDLAAAVPAVPTKPLT